MGIAIETDNGTIDAYVGKVLAKSESNGGQDSSFSAWVWDESSNDVIEMCDGSTAYAGPMNTAKIDATEDVVALVMDRMVGELKENVQIPRYADMAPGVGMRVKSLTSKGKAVGVVGTILSEGTGKYGPYFNVEDETSSRVVMISKSKVQSVGTLAGTGNMGRIDAHVLALIVARKVWAMGEGLLKAYVMNKRDFARGLVKEAVDQFGEYMGAYEYAGELIEDMEWEGSYGFCSLFASRLIGD